MLPGRELPHNLNASRLHVYLPVGEEDSPLLGVHLVVGERQPQWHRIGGSQ